MLQYKLYQHKPQIIQEPLKTQAISRISWVAFYLVKEKQKRWV